jgi:hypothetical protein
MNLEQIVWPVFRLGEREPQRDNGVVYYATEYSDLDTSEHTATFRVVDDTSVAGETLSRRRLILARDDVPLYPIRQAIYFLGDLLKLAKATTWFIDSSGQLFQHKKSTRAKLVVRKIKNVFPTTGLGAVIELECIPQRFKTTFKPGADAEYAALLQCGLTYIFYGLYSDKPAESWRLI